MEASLDNSSEERLPQEQIMERGIGTDHIMGAGEESTNENSRGRRPQRSWHAAPHQLPERVSAPRYESTSTDDHHGTLSTKDRSQRQRLAGPSDGAVAGTSKSTPWRNSLGSCFESARKVVCGGRRNAGAESWLMFFLD
jgi:hypothetical protein